MRAALHTALALLLAALVTAPPARADDDCRGWAIPPAAAIVIAASVGLVAVKEIDCDDGEWEIEGWTAFGREIEVEIDARTGRIIAVEVDD